MKTFQEGDDESPSLNYKWKRRCGRTGGKTKQIGRSETDKTLTWGQLMGLGYYFDTSLKW